MKNRGKYNLALVPSPSAIGYAAVDDQLNLTQPLHHKTSIGVRSFGEASVAEDRRISRGARRNNRRKKSRLKALGEILKPEIDKEDPLMFDRINQSELSPLDDSKKFKTIIFDRQNVEAFYNKKFPTIYHLQKYLMETNDKADIRLIYLALHAMLKNRGHFFNSTPVSQFKPGKIDIKNALLELNQLSSIEELSFAVGNSPEIEHVLTDNSIFKKSKIKQLKELLIEKESDKTIAKRNQKIATQIANAILGNTFHFDEILLLDLDKEEKKSWKFKLDDPSLDEKIDEISGKLLPEQLRTFEILQELFGSVTLVNVLKGSSSLVEAKIKDYDKHKRDMHFYFKYLKTLPEDKAKLLKEAYTLYIGNRQRDLLQCRKDLGVGVAKNYDQASFYKLVTKMLEPDNTNPDAKKILELLKTGDFLKKQRTNENSYVPYQLNAITFNKILENQGKYYPVLIEENPALPDRKEAPYKLSQLFQFTLPYYVGPLATPEEQAAQNIPESSRFAWMVRKEPGAINCWNFYKKVDVIATANAFIKRCIGKDTYLLTEPVLPKASLLYQKYMVLDELSNISINDKKLTVSMKQILFNEVFKKHTTVSTARVEKALEKHNIDVKSISGLSDPKKFNSSLSTYNSWRKAFPEQIDNLQFREDIEKMIEWATVFEDRQILAEKLKEIDWLTPKQVKFVVGQKLIGWGKLSRKLLEGIKDKNGKSIISSLYTTRRNFIQIINSAVYKVQIEEIKQKVAQTQSLEDIISEAYISPANRKAIRQAIKVIDEFIDIYGHAPDKICLMFQRSESQIKELTQSRIQYLNKVYRQIQKSPLYEKQLDDELKKISKKRSLTTKEYLYFQQLGRDALTGEVLDLKQIKSYSLLHIIPRSKMADDSMNNKVLTKVKSFKTSVIVEYGNRTIEGLGCSVKTLWHDWQKLGLINKGKLNNLLSDVESLNKYQSKGYVARQLVETNQVIKLLATILQGKLKNTKIIEVRNDQVSNIRYVFDLYKIKEMNEYYRGFDAYLAAVAGLYLYKVYPKARRFFVYGEYLKAKKDQDDEKEDSKPLTNFNFLWQLLYGKDNRINVNHTDTLAFDRNKLIDNIKDVYHFKYQNYSIATEVREKMLFKATLFPRITRDLASKRSLIAKKKDFDTEIYGGYSANQNSFFTLVELTKVNGEKLYEFYGMPARFVGELKRAKGTDRYDKVFNEQIKKVIDSTAPKYKSFKILKKVVPFNQVVIDEGSRFFMSSSQYRYNARQLVLSDTSKKTLMDLMVDPEFNLHRQIKEKKDNNERLISVYDEILDQVKKYMPMFKINRNIEKLEEGSKLFVKLPINKKVNAIRGILVALHSNSARIPLKDLKITALSCSKKRNPITVDAQFVYQSPTGMQERRIPIKALLK